MIDTSIDLTAPHAVLFMLLHFPLTDRQLARILGTDEESVRAGIAALSAEGRGVDRPEVTFATQVKCWRTGLLCKVPGPTPRTYVWKEPVDEYRYVLFDIKDSGHEYGYYGTMKDVLYGDRFAPIDERIRTFEPALRAMVGYTRSRYTRLLRWLRFVGLSRLVGQGQRVVRVEFWPEVSVDWEWHTPRGRLATPESAFDWGMEWVADRFRRELGFTLSKDTQARLQAIIDERFPEKSPGRRHINLLMTHESVEDVREAGKLPFKGGVAGADSLPAAIIQTCEKLCENQLIRALLLVRTDDYEEVRRLKVPHPAQTETEAQPSRSVFEGDPKDMRVDELTLSVRSANALSHMGIEHVGQLTEKTETELLKTKGFGRRSLNEIKKILTDMGLSLKQPDA